MSLEIENNFLNSEEAMMAFRELWTGLAWERRSDAPRYEYWTNKLNRDYTYGRGAGVRTYSAKPEPEWVTKVNERLADRLGFEFEGCFLNGYDAGRNKPDWLGWHEDDDDGIDHSKPIAIVTLYAPPGTNTRSLFTREKIGVDDSGRMEYGDPVETILENGSLVLMPAGFQDTHQHAILKPAGKWDSRISMTFRSLI